jgi:large subunit ribosomal protein L18
VSLLRKNKQRKQRRAERVRAKLKLSTMPRVSVFRSLNHIYVQLIDDMQQHTIASCSSVDVDVKGDKKEKAHAVGIELAKRALQKGVNQAKLDRGSLLYHGRVKALAEGLREGGLQI